MVYLRIHLVDFYVFFVGKYTIHGSYLGVLLGPNITLIFVTVPNGGENMVMNPMGSNP